VCNEARALRIDMPVSMGALAVSARRTRLERHGATCGLLPLHPGSQRAMAKAPPQGLRGLAAADGYAGFEDIYRLGRITEVACLAHVRRTFFEIYLAQGSGIATEAADWIR